MSSAVPRNNEDLREKIHQVIFEAETPMGLLFDVALLVAILFSVIVVCADTVQGLHDRLGNLFRALEWFFTVLFTIEYCLRLYCVRRPWKYALSFFGIIDLLAILPTYLGVFLSGTPSFAAIRTFRLLRIFRIFKLVWFLGEADELGRAIVEARGKVIVFVGVVAIAITIAGTLMYEIENWGHSNSPIESNAVGKAETDEQIQQQILAVQGRLDDALASQDFALAARLLQEMEKVKSGGQVKSKFTSIPESMYWATVTMTTVGYGDIVPTTAAGKLVAAVLILLGYSLIIVPTGFVSAEFISQRSRKKVSTQSCPYCVTEGHDQDAVYCKYCGKEM